MAFFYPKGHPPEVHSDANPALAKADSAIRTLDEAIDESRSLTQKLQVLYADRGRDGFNAFVSDVALAEQLSRHVLGPHLK